MNREIGILLKNKHDNNKNKQNWLQRNGEGMHQIACMHQLFALNFKIIFLSIFSH